MKALVDGRVDVHKFAWYTKHQDTITTVFSLKGMATKGYMWMGKNYWTVLIYIIEKKDSTKACTGYLQIVSRRETPEV